jgi:hypothetical protein
LFQLIRNKFMHEITYSRNVPPPHFAARGIPKNTPHGTMEGHTAYIYTRTGGAEPIRRFKFSAMPTSV